MTIQGTGSGNTLGVGPLFPPNAGGAGELEESSGSARSRPVPLVWVVALRVESPSSAETSVTEMVPLSRFVPTRRGRTRVRSQEAIRRDSQSSAQLRTQSVIASARITNSAQFGFARLLSSGVAKFKSTSNWAELAVGPAAPFVGVNRNGVLIVRGARSVASARRLLKEAARVATGRLSVRVSHLRIANIVATTDFGRPIDLRTLALSRLFEQVFYDPEFFPGLMIRFDGTNCTVLLFSSGKAVIVGIKSLAEGRQFLLGVAKTLIRL